MRVKWKYQLSPSPWFHRPAEKCSFSCRYLAVDKIRSDRKWKWKENMFSHQVQKSTGLLWNAYSAALSYPYYFHPATRLGSKVGQRSKIEPSLANKGWFDVNQSGSCQHCWRSFKNFFVLRFSREKQLNLHILLCCFPLPPNKKYFSKTFLSTDIYRAIFSLLTTTDLMSIWQLSARLPRFLENLFLHKNRFKRWLIIWILSAKSRVATVSTISLFSLPQFSLQGRLTNNQPL